MNDGPVATMSPPAVSSNSTWSSSIAMVSPPVRNGDTRKVQSARKVASSSRHQGASSNGSKKNPHNSNAPSDQANLPTWTALEHSSDDDDELSTWVKTPSNGLKNRKSTHKHDDQPREPQVSLSASRPLLLPHGPSNNGLASNSILSKNTLDKLTTTREPLFLPDDDSSPDGSSTGSFSYAPRPSLSSLAAPTTAPTTSNTKLTVKGTTRTPNTKIHPFFAGVVITKPPPRKKISKSTQKPRQTNVDRTPKAKENIVIEIPDSSGDMTPSTSQPHQPTSSTSDIRADRASDDSPRKVSEKRPRPSSSFLGVVITTSPSKPKPTEENSLASVLSRAFIQNEQSLGATGATSVPANRVRPHQPREAKHTTARTAKIALAARPLTQADIDAYLGTVVARSAMPREGCKYDPWQWEDNREERLEMNLRFFREDWEAGTMKVEGQMEIGVKVYATPFKSRTEEFIDSLEVMFGPGSIHRGWATAMPKPLPKRRNGEEKASRGQTVSREASLGGGAAGKRPRDGDEDEEEPHKKAKLDTDVEGWTRGFQKLIKGKMRLEEEDMKKLSDMLDEIDRAKGDLQEVQHETRLGDVLEQLSKMRESEIPFGDAERLQLRAGTISEFWRKNKN